MTASSATACCMERCTALQCTVRATLRLYHHTAILRSHSTAGVSASVACEPGACVQPCAASQPIASGCQVPTCAEPHRRMSAAKRRGRRPPHTAIGSSIPVTRGYESNARALNPVGRFCHPRGQCRAADPERYACQHAAVQCARHRDGSVWLLQCVAETSGVSHISNLVSTFRRAEA